MGEPQTEGTVRLRAGAVSEVWRAGGRFEKRYAVLWPWIPLLAALKGNVPQLDARREARNADRLRGLGVAAPAVAWTTSRWRLAPGRLGAVHETTIALEPLAGVPLDELLARSPPPPPAERRRAAAALGATVARMHAAGIFHRDLYLCHAVWDGARIGVLDVARADRRRFRHARWRAKDLAALALSAAGARAGRREAAAFLRAYFGGGTRIDRALLRRVAAKAARMARHGKKG